MFKNILISWNQLIFLYRFIKISVPWYIIQNIPECDISFYKNWIVKGTLLYEIYKFEQNIFKLKNIN